MSGVSGSGSGAGSAGHAAAAGGSGEVVLVPNMASFWGARKRAGYAGGRGGPRVVYAIPDSYFDQPCSHPHSHSQFAGSARAVAIATSSTS